MPNFDYLHSLMLSACGSKHTYTTTYAHAVEAVRVMESRRVQESSKGAPSPIGGEARPTNGVPNGTTMPCQ